jgi:hypothetical protein
MMGKRVGGPWVNFGKTQGGKCKLSECLNLSVQISKQSSTAKDTPVGNGSCKISARCGITLFYVGFRENTYGNPVRGTEHFFFCHNPLLAGFPHSGAVGTHFRGI